MKSFADLLAVLEKRDVPAVVDEQRQAVEIPTFIRGEGHRAVLLWDPRATLFQVIQPLNIPVSVSDEAGVVDALARVNHQLVLPGFGYDHDRRVIYFRWVVPRAPDGGLSEDALDRAVATVLQSCRDFLPGLRAVAEGKVNASEIIPFSAALLERERAPTLQP